MNGNSLIYWTYALSRWCVDTLLNALISV